MIQRTLLIALATGCFLGTGSTLATAQYVDWNHIGLERAWTFQAATEPARSGDIHVAIYVSSEKNRTVYEVSYEGGPKGVFVSGQVDRSGNRLNAESAAFQADVELRTLKALGHDDAKIETREVPDVSLLIQTGSGQLSLLDGETGQLHWSLTVGKHNLTNQRPAIGERYAVAVNGTSLYIINKATGKLEQVKRLSGVPDAGPMVTGAQVIVPTMRRPFEVHSLKDGKLHTPAMFRASFGRITSPPVATPESVTWATDRGFLFIADPNNALPLARIEARQGIVGTPVFVPPDQVVVGIEDGYVLAVELKRQSIQWEFFTGQSLSESPFAMNGIVYAPTAQNELYALKAEDGKLKWNVGGVARVVGGLGERLYCVDQTGNLSIVDVTDGRKLGAAPIGRHDQLLTNALTDRIYVVRGGGLIECLRAVGARWPTTHRMPAATTSAAEQSDERITDEPASPGSDGDDAELSDREFDDAMSLDEPADDNSDDTEAAAEEDNPFDAAGDNPFDTGDGEDPFADAGDDPFG